MGKNEKKIIYAMMRYEMEQRIKESTPSDEWEN